MKVAVLGNGQLGSMLQQAGQRIGIEVQLLDIDDGELPGPDVLITAEREHWPTNALTQAVQNHPEWLNSDAFAVLANRIRQKNLLNRLGLPSAPWLALSGDITQQDIHRQLGPDVFLKRASGGYDGYGQLRLRQNSAQDLSEWNTEVIAEQAINFDREVSIIGARNKAGQTVSYRITENRHVNGILRISLSQPDSDPALQLAAERMLNTVMHELNYVGVMAMECFVVNGELLVNEIAPRVHNSGHWTQAGASISQFELHLRAICGLHLPPPEQIGVTLMINLLGLHYDTTWLRHAAAQLHWYGKTWRPGRKMGHLNLHHPNPAKLVNWLQELDLPREYQTDVQWAIERLN